MGCEEAGPTYRSSFPPSRHCPSPDLHPAAVAVFDDPELPRAAAKHMHAYNSLNGIVAHMARLSTRRWIEAGTRNWARDDRASGMGVATSDDEVSDVTMCSNNFAHTHAPPAHAQTDKRSPMHAEVLAFGKRFLNAGPTRLVYMALAASPLQRPLTCSKTMRRSSDTTATMLIEGVPIQSRFCHGVATPRSVPS